MIQTTGNNEIKSIQRRLNEGLLNGASIPFHLVDVDFPSATLAVEYLPIEALLFCLGLQSACKLS